MATFSPLLIVAILLPACAAPPPAGDGPPPLERIVRAARADAAQRSGLPAAQLPLLAAEAVTWADGSLGCPVPGRLYTQALVPGYRVTLRVGSQAWTYHAGERGGPVLCPPERAQEPAPDLRR